MEKSRSKRYGNASLRLRIDLLTCWGIAGNATNHEPEDIHIQNIRRAILHKAKLEEKRGGELERQVENNEENHMSDWLTPVLDQYDRKARLRPALLCGFPLIASVVLLIPEFGAIWGSIGVVIVYCGGSILLTQIGRNLGKALENRLYQSWGGKPSAAMLRHTDSRLAKPTTDRYRSFLSSAVPGLTLASRQDEEKNPEQADAGYESANRWLLEHTRDHARFNLLFAENMNYGFRRSLLVLKPVALGIDSVALMLVIGMAVASWTGQIVSTLPALSPEWWASVVITAGHTLLFVAYIRADWVRMAAETYAQQLLAACDSLEGKIHT